VVGVDIDIRAHNRSAIESHPMARRIRLVQGSSTDGNVVEEVRRLAAGSKRTMVLLDSNHTHEHVLQELRLYAPLVSKNCYLVVFDTLLDDMPADLIRDRPWGHGNNPKTALREYLRGTDRFEVDRDIDAKLLISAAPEGYLRCVRA
jgi:cephalosporin hydroxylase